MLEFFFACSNCIFLSQEAQLGHELSVCFIAVFCGEPAITITVAATQAATISIDMFFM